MIIHGSCKLTLYLTTVSFLLGLTNNKSDIREFGAWLNMTAGALSAAGKTLFVHYYRHELTEFMKRVTRLDEKLQQKSQSDPFVRKMRNRYFILECGLVCSSVFFTALMGVAFYLPSLFKDTISVPPPARIGWDFEESKIGFVVCFVINFVGCVWGGFMIVCLDFFLGNMFNQLILNFKVLVHEIRVLGQSVVVVDVKKELIVIIKDYQYLRECVQIFNRDFQPVLLLLVIANTFLLTLISIELALLINVDVSLVLGPAMYFCFQSIPFFYWCWLGQRMSDLVSILNVVICLGN